ncbi:MAG: sugar transferase [Hyphomonadaceae bacterium]
MELPRAPGDKQAPQKSEAANQFEAALRRDLAAAPVVAYEAVLGGWSKRALDLALVIFSAPIWTLALGAAALIAKLRHPSAVFVAHERIGYGGRAFKAFSLRVSPPSAVIARLHKAEPIPANDLTAIAQEAEEAGAKWTRALARLPQLLNVLRGEMALVGPLPLTRDELAEVKSGRRYYLSARPGVVGVAAVADSDDETSSQYKMYALSWSHLTDALLLWEGLRSLRTRGELWRPGVKVLGRRTAQVRQRVAGG